MQAVAREGGHAKRNPRLARERVIEKRALPSPHTLARRRFRLAEDECIDSQVRAETDEGCGDSRGRTLNVFHEVESSMTAFSTRLKIRNPSLLLSSSGWKTELEFGRRIHLEGIHL